MRLRFTFSQTIDVDSTDIPLGKRRRQPGEGPAAHEARIERLMTDAAWGEFGDTALHPEDFEISEPEGIV